MASSDHKKRNFDDYIDGSSKEECSETNRGARGGGGRWGQSSSDADSGRATNRQRVGVDEPSGSNPYNNRGPRWGSSSSNLQALGLPARPPSPSPTQFQHPRPDPTPAAGSAPDTPIDLAYPSTSPHAPPPRPTAFQLPTQITSFSYDNSHTQLFDNSSLRYYNEGKEPIGASLSEGFERWVRKPSDSGRIDALLKAIVRCPTARGNTNANDTEPEGGVEERVVGNPTMKDLGVVSWRGIMTKILTAPYEERDGWELLVMPINGTLYFQEYLSEARLREKDDMTPRQATQTYYGYAFESYCTREQPAEGDKEGENEGGQARSRRANDPSGPGVRGPAAQRQVQYEWGGDVDNNVQWCSVVRTKLGDTRLVIGGEVDCVRGKYTGQPDTFVELKTSLAIRNQGDEARFERKLLKFYFQSFLLGVPEIVVGFRTPGGVVTTVQTFKTMQIPRMVRGKAHGWDPVLCLEWGQRFLTWMRDQVGRRDWRRVSVWRVSFVPGRGVRCGVLSDEELRGIEGSGRKGIVPQWYWDLAVGSSD